jgi:hypothetical protein
MSGDDSMEQLRFLQYNSDDIAMVALKIGVWEDKLQYSTLIGGKIELPYSLQTYINNSDPNFL